MSPEAPLNELSREELIALFREQQRLIAALRAEIEELKRSQGRPAAPFSKGPKADPKRPGRKPGQGPFLRRAAPLHAPTETVAAQVPECCPACGGLLDPIGEEWATTTELPLRPQPVVTAWRVPRAGAGNAGNGCAERLPAWRRIKPEPLPIVWDQESWPPRMHCTTASVCR